MFSISYTLMKAKSMVIARRCWDGTELQQGVKKDWLVGTKFWLSRNKLYCSVAQ